MSSITLTAQTAKLKRPAARQKRGAMTDSSTDLLKLFARRVMPAGQLIDRVGVLGDLLDEIQKRLTGVEALERRVAELERRVAELSANPRSTQKARRRSSAAATKRPTAADEPMERT